MAREIKNIGETKELLEQNAQGAPVKDVNWKVNELEVDSVPIIDPGEGEGRVLRHFFFKANPEQNRGNKLDVIRSFQKLIEISLYSDGLVPVYNQPLEVHSRRSVKRVSKVLYQALLENRADFVIQVLAEPKQGYTRRAFFNQTPTKL